ncbi:MAG: hypothetical protein AB7Q42_08465 [Acidimicrobiia bacterium]
MHLERPARHGPWFWAHPVPALGVAVALTAAICVLRFAVGSVEDSIADLYAFPVALVALTSGRRAGFVAGVIATGLLLWWVLAAGEHLTLLGWMSRIIPLVLLGTLVGDAADRIRDADRTERRARRLEVLGRETAEVHDSMMQHLAVAKWRLESGDTEHGLDSLTAAMLDAQDLVRELLDSASAVPGDRLRSQSAGSSTAATSRIGPVTVAGVPGHLERTAARGGRVRWRFPRSDR